MMLSALRGQDHVVRFEVAVDDAPSVRRTDRRQQLLDDVQRLVQRQRTLLLEEGPESPPVHVLHDDEEGPVHLVEVVDAHDPGVVERGDCRRLALEAASKGLVRRVAFGKYLDRDGHLEARVKSAVDDTHRPAPQFRLDYEPPEMLQ